MTVEPEPLTSSVWTLSSGVGAGRALRGTPPDSEVDWVEVESFDEDGGCCCCSGLDDILRVCVVVEKRLIWWWL